jgi:hypothetical protein
VRFLFFKCGHPTGWEGSVLFFIAGFLARAAKSLVFIGCQTFQVFETVSKTWKVCARKNEIIYGRFRLR